MEENQYCHENTLYVCAQMKNSNEFKWQKSTSCAENASSKSKTECGECKNNEIRCVDGYISKCVKGTWETQDSCGGRDCAKDGKSCDKAD